MHRPARWGIKNAKYPGAKCEVSGQPPACCTKPEVAVDAKGEAKANGTAATASHIGDIEARYEE